jgi:hypothetical protein
LGATRSADTLIAADAGSPADSVLASIAPFSLTSPLSLAAASIQLNR